MASCSGSSCVLRQIDLSTARDALATGKLVLFPTETFFALGCDAMNPDAVGSVFSLKKRSLSMPLPVVVGARDQVRELALHISDLAEELMDAFWPGPLSLVLPARPEVPDLLTANVHHIAVRFSPHPAVLELCEATGRILVASSANVSGTPPVAALDRLDPALASGVAGVYASGPEPEGRYPSTVVDIKEARGAGCVRVLRAGAISVESLQAAGFTVLDMTAPE